MPALLNISAYKFVPIADPHALRERLLAAAGAGNLKGTILLAQEGVNLFLAGPSEAVRRFVAQLRADERLADLAPKESWSEAQPFARLKVKVKAEIIRMNQPAVQPAAGRAPSVHAHTLQRWLDAGRDDDGRELVLLDTRNAFEVDLGRFAGALDWRLQRFSDFPAALREHAHTLRDKAVVSYCTGGIRCEKANLVMREAGLEHAWQLDGGILKYFELTDGAPHWQGRCFVFDERVALGPGLDPDSGC